MSKEISDAMAAFHGLYCGNCQNYINELSAYSDHRRIWFCRKSREVHGEDDKCNRTLDFKKR